MNLSYFCNLNNCQAHKAQALYAIFDKSRITRQGD